MNLLFACAKYYRQLFCLTTLLYFALPLSTAQAQADTASALSGLTITLTVPASTPANSNVYVAGSFNGWEADAASYKLAVQEDGRYKITLPASVRGKVEFKFTLGSWSSGEMQADGSETPNRNFDISVATANQYQGTVQAWKQSAKTLAELKLELEKILSETHTPGLSVAIVRKDGVEWAAGLGLADVASNRPATADTLFRIGSVSKNFTALAILKLVDQGKLSLQDPVRKLVPEVWFENPWEETDPVRVVDLLEHTTGWNDMHFREYAKDAAAMTTSDALNYHHGSRISRWRPGTRMSYSNTGPAVAALIVEKISGQIFEDYVTQNFFIPIGMKTATYFQPEADNAVTLYQQDGKTPFPYWNILFRSAGSINASANDMAAYLSFFLNRGEVNGAEILPASSVDRIEIPTRDWAAQQGVSAGYGLYNMATVESGRVFHGHDGGVNGGLTSFTYLAEQGVGFFCSINSGNGEAFFRIRSALRDYIVLGLAKPEPTPTIALPKHIGDYTGWYEPASPRNQQFQFIERLLGLTYFSIADGQLKATSLMLPEQRFNSVSANLLRSPSDPVATMALVPANSDGTFIVRQNTLKQIPTGLAYAEIALAAGFLLSLVTILLYAPVWLVAQCCKTLRRPEELWLKAWPLIAALSLAAIGLLLWAAGEDFISQLGNMTLYSLGIFLATLIFATASMASAVALYVLDKRKIRGFIYYYSMVVVAMLLVATAYLSYWGVIAIRLWA